MPRRSTRRTSTLAAVRKRIDALDERVLRLINHRAALALEIGRIKKRKKWPVFDAKREAFVLRHVQIANRGPLSPSATRHVFQAILCVCRRRERSGSSRRLKPRPWREALTQEIVRRVWRPQGPRADLRGGATRGR